MDTIALQTWDIYFATILGIKLHPGNKDQQTIDGKIKEAAMIADMMIEQRNRRKPCQFGQV